MKNFICEKVYDLLYRFDNVEEYDYETAPYCGHHYSGHQGKRTMSAYHEGMGYKEGKFGWLWVSKNTEAKDWSWGFRVFKSPIVVRRTDSHVIYFNGFIGGHSGFINKWWDGFKPFRGRSTAWHILGFRFTKRPFGV
jgi:hypothetical protein